MKIINLIKPWELSKIIIILNILIILIIKKNFKKVKKINNLIIIIITINILLHTKIDFFSQHILFINKIQNLIICHIIPITLNLKIFKNIKNINKFLIKKKFKIKEKYYIFLLLIEIILYFPIINFYNMLNEKLYKLTNWIILIINIKTIPNIINNKNKIKNKKINYKWIYIIPKIILGVQIYYNKKDIYNIYNLCGQILIINIITNQQISGLIIWIVTSMMYLINNILYF